MLYFEAKSANACAQKIHAMSRYHSAQIGKNDIRRGSPFFRPTITSEYEL